MGKEIRTVLGALPPGDLGLTSMHDHILYDGSAECLRARAAVLPGRGRREWFPMEDDDPVTLENVGMLQRNALLSRDAFRQTDEAELLEEARLYRAAGGAAILSVDPVGFPPCALPALRRISEGSGVHIVASAGCGAPGAPGRTPAEYLAPLMEAAADPSVGHLAAPMEGAGPSEENALRAAARAAKETGLSLTVLLRGNPVELAGRAAALLGEEGAPPDRVVLAGVPLSTRPGLPEAVRNPSSVAMDTSAAQRLLDGGYNLAFCITNAMGFELAGGYDRGDFLDFAGIYSLVEKGYCRQLVLGNGCRGKITLHTGGGEGYCRLPYYVIPMLRDTAGLSDYAVRRMTVENPARILAV